MTSGKRVLDTLRADVAIIDAYLPAPNNADLTLKVYLTGIGAELELHTERTCAMRAQVLTGGEVAVELRTVREILGSQINGDVQEPALKTCGQCVPETIDATLGTQLYRCRHLAIDADAVGRYERFPPEHLEIVQLLRRAVSLEMRRLGLGNEEAFKSAGLGDVRTELDKRLKEHATTIDALMRHRQRESIEVLANWTEHHHEDQHHAWVARLMDPVELDDIVVFAVETAALARQGHNTESDHPWICDVEVETLVGCCWMIHRSVDRLVMRGPRVVAEWLSEFAVDPTTALKPADQPFTIVDDTNASITETAMTLWDPRPGSVYRRFLDALSAAQQL